MDHLLSMIFNLEAYESRAERLRARFLYIVLMTLIVLGTIIAINEIINGNVIVAYLILASSLISLISFGLIRTQRITAASWLLLSTLLVVVLANNIVDGSLGVISLLVHALFLVLGSFLLGAQGIVVFTIFSVLQVLFFPVVGFSDGTIFNSFVLVVIYIALGGVSYGYNQFVAENRLEGQDVESEERFKLVSVSTEISQMASEHRGLEAALGKTLQLLDKNYAEIYHWRVFLLNEDNIQASLVASSGNGDRALIEGAYQVAVGSLSAVGQAAFKNDVVITQPDDSDMLYNEYDFLAETSLQAAFPLRIGETVIGVLDLQSKTLKRLLASQRVTFESIANSISLMIDSIRQFEQAQIRAEENQRLADRAQTALREVERLNQRLIGRAWTEYLDEAEQNLGLEIDFVNDVHQPTTEWTENLITATGINNFVQNEDVIAIPLRVRGQIIGAMEFELGENRRLAPEDLELITEVSERFGLAIENTRLVEESLRTAQRETTINQMTSRFQVAQNVETTLAEAARSLSEALSADTVMIRLGIPDDASSNGKDA